MSLRCRALINLDAWVEDLDLGLAYEWLYHTLILNFDAFIVCRRRSIILLPLLLAEVPRLVKLRRAGIFRFLARVKRNRPAHKDSGVLIFAKDTNPVLAHFLMLLK